MQLGGLLERPDCKKVDHKVIFARVRALLGGETTVRTDRGDVIEAIDCLANHLNRLKPDATAEVGEDRYRPFLRASIAKLLKTFGFL